MGESVHKLLFRNPVFREGKNVTVRRGIKWSLETEAYIKNIGIVELSSVVIRAADIMNEMIEFEHDPSCRNRYGLINELRRIYPGFNENEIVTILSFNVCSKNK